MAGLLPRLGSSASGPLLFTLQQRNMAEGMGKGKVRASSANLGEERSLRPVKCSMLEQPLPTGDRTEETSWPWCKALGIGGDRVKVTVRALPTVGTLRPNYFSDWLQWTAKVLVSCPNRGPEPTPVFILENRARGLRVQRLYTGDLGQHSMGVGCMGSIFMPDQSWILLLPGCGRAPCFI